MSSAIQPETASAIDTTIARAHVQMFENLGQLELGAMRLLRMGRTRDALVLLKSGLGSQRPSRMTAMIVAVASAHAADSRAAQQWVRQSAETPRRTAGLLRAWLDAEWNMLEREVAQALETKGHPRL